MESRAFKQKKELMDDKAWIVIDDCLPAIIDKNTWKRVRESKLNRPSIALRAQTSTHLLGGILKCGMRIGDE